MYTKKTQQKFFSRTIQSKPGGGRVYMEDNRPFIKSHVLQGVFTATKNQEMNKDKQDWFATLESDFSNLIPSCYRLAPSVQFVLSASHCYGNKGCTILYRKTKNLKTPSFSPKEDFGDFSDCGSESSSISTLSIILRLVIFIDIENHDSLEDMRFTLLHEWFAHAEPLIEEIPTIQKVGILSKITQKRCDKEHKKYASAENATLISWISRAGIDDSSLKVLAGLQKDQEHYSKRTGKWLRRIIR